MWLILFYVSIYNKYAIKMTVMHNFLYRTDSVFFCASLQNSCLGHPSNLSYTQIIKKHKSSKA